MISCQRSVSTRFSTARGLFAAILSAICIANSAPAAARDVFITRVTPTNTPTVFYFHSVAQNCQGVAIERLGRRATVVVPERPTNGLLTISAGEAPVARCQGRKGLATIVTYTPEHNFSGADAFKLGVHYELENRMVLQHVNVKVLVGGSANRD